MKKLNAKWYVQVKKISCDNAGKNYSLEALHKKEENGITFEYKAPSTPQKNGHAEQKLQCCLAEWNKC